MRLLITLFLVLPALLHARIVPYPNNVQAEGVTHAAGSNFFFADLRTGDIYLADVSTRLVTRAVRSPRNRTSVGIHNREGRLFAAGGGRPFFDQAALYVYDTPTGRTIASCPIDADGSLVNDVVADRDFAYYTDSFLGRIYKLALQKLPDCDVETIDLPRPTFPRQTDGANANGLIRYKEGLIVVHFNLSTIFFVDLINGNKVQQILPTGSMPGADGLDIDRKKGGSLLFVAQNVLNQVSMWKLGMDDERKVSATFLKNFTSPELAFPTTVAVNDEYVVATSSRLDTVDFMKPVPKNVTLGLVTFRR